MKNTWKGLQEIRIFLIIWLVACNASRGKPLQKKGTLQITGHTVISNDGSGNVTVEYTGDPIFEPLLEDPYEGLTRPARSVPCDPPAALLQGKVRISKVIMGVYQCLCTLENRLSNKWKPLVQKAIASTALPDDAVPSLVEIAGTNFLRCQLERLTTTPFVLPPFKRCVEYSMADLEDQFNATRDWNTSPYLDERQRDIERLSSTIPCFDPTTKIVFQHILAYHATLQVAPKIDEVLTEDPLSYSIAEAFVVVPKGAIISQLVFGTETAAQILEALQTIQQYSRKEAYIGYTYIGDTITLYMAESYKSTFAPQIGPKNPKLAPEYSFMSGQGLIVVDE